MGNAISQAWPPAPALTEKELADQSGKVYNSCTGQLSVHDLLSKVFIVTGSTAGVGKELAEILCSRNAKIYIAARSAEKASAVISQVQAKYPESKGELGFLYLDLADLLTIKQSADEYLSKEQRLDVLWNNAAVMAPPQGSVTKQGYELQLGTNTLDPFLFTKLLTPLLVRTAKLAPPSSVRVVWVSSSAAELVSPYGGLDLTNLENKSDRSTHYKYATSKADGIVSVCLNPGNLQTGPSKNFGFWLTVLTKILVHPPIFGAYVELFTGCLRRYRLKGLGFEVRSNLSHLFQPDSILTQYSVVPWGRFALLRNDLEQAAKTEAEGGKGTAKKFWAWSEEQVELYLE